MKLGLTNVIADPLVRQCSGIHMPLTWKKWRVMSQLMGGSSGKAMCSHIDCWLWRFSCHNTVLKKDWRFLEISVQRGKGCIELLEVSLTRWIGTSIFCKGPYLNDVYTEGGGGLAKWRHSKGGCVDLVLWILPKCRQGGEGVQNPKNCVDVI